MTGGDLLHPFVHLDVKQHLNVAEKLLRVPFIHRVARDRWALNFPKPTWRGAALDLDGEVALTLREIWGLVENALCADVIRRFTRRFKDTPQSLAPLAGLRHGRRSLAPCGSLLSTGQVEKWMCHETGFDHTLITRRASVGVIGQKRPTRIHLEAATFD